MTRAINREVRVLLVAPRFAPDIGGLESYVGWVAAILRDEPGFEVSVLTTAKGRHDVHEMIQGVAVHRLATLATLSNTPVHPGWVRRIRGLVDRIDPDVLNVHSPVPGLADLAVLGAGGRPVVLTYHSGSMVKGGSPADPLLRAYERHLLPRIFERCSHLVAVSPIATTWATGRAEMITPGVDTTLMSPPPTGTARGPRFVYAGRLERSSRWKGVPVLLEALSLLRADHREVGLDVAGAGDDLRSLQTLAERLGVADHVTWHGALGAAALAATYGRATATVLASLTESESFGMTLIESMSCGTAVIGSDVGGIAHVVDEGRTGLLFPPGDARALAVAMARLLEEPGLAERLGAAGRVAALQRFDWSLQRSRTLDLLTTAAGSRTWVS